MEKINKEYIRTTSNSIYNFEVEPNADENNNMLNLVKTITKTTLTLVILNQAVLPITDVKINEDDSLKKIYSTFNENKNFEDSFQTTYPTNFNYPIESEGETVMSDDIRQKDLDNLEEKNNLKLENIDNKLENINSSIEDLKIMIKDMDEKIKKQPTKEFVENQINRSTVNYLLWLGAGLVAVAGFLAWYLPMVINVPY